MEQQHQHAYDDKKRREEYASAQRSAVESVMIGRATAEAVHHQGEQLKRAEQLADETQYKLNKANRLLKGMTWGGWVSNIFTPDVKPPGSMEGSSVINQVNFEQYDSFPENCHATAQAMRNYHANVSILEQCDTEEQKATCVQICNSMYAAVCRRLQEDALEGAYGLQFKKDLEILRKRQIASQKQIRGLVDAIATNPTNESSATDAAKTELFGRAPQPQRKQAVAPAPTASSQLEQEQDQHLNVLATSLGELGHIAQSLNEGLFEQQDRIESLDTKSENVLESSKLVGRRTDRLIQNKSWTKAKPVFCCNVMIRNHESGKYLTIIGKELWLMDQIHPTNSKFRLYKRQGSVFGFQCDGTRQWVGQSWTGGLCCSSASFNRREEWQADNTNDWKFNVTTKLLCASAGWGQGGYLHVDNKFEIHIGGTDTTRTAAKWIIINTDVDH